MNERNSVSLVTHRLSRWLMTTALIAVLVLLGNSALAQITYSESFTGCNAATCNGWTISGGYSASITDQDPFAEGYFPCSAANPAVKSNLYSAATTTTITSSSLGTSSGALATLSFIYKVEDYLTAAATPAGEAQLAVSFGTSASGPWTLISSFTNPVTAGCIAPPALTFLPTAASPVFIQIVVTNIDPLIDIDGFWIVIDDVTLNQGAGGGCVGSPTPGNTLASVASACDGVNFTLSLQNGTAGNDVTYQWQYDNGGGMTNFGGGGPTQVVSQSVATTYQCIVTCPSSLPGVASTPLAVGVTSQYPVDFAPVTPFPSNCWTATNATFLTRDAVSAFGIGSGSARWNFYQDGGGIEYSLVSPTIPAIPAGYQIRFDVAGAAYIGGEIDRIFLEYSTTGNAGPWTQIVEMTNAPGGVLNTLGGAGTTSALFIPTSGQWSTLTYPVPAGTNAVQFRGVSEWGNEVYVDNINFEIIPTCFSPSFASLTAAVATATTANIAWGSDGSALTYDVEIRQGGTPGSGGANFTTNTASTSVLANSGLTFGQTYDVYVRSQCGINGTGSWTGPRTLLMDYCVAGANLLGDPVITNFTFAGINQGNASSAGYLNFTAATASVAPGVGSPFTLTRQTAYSNDSLVVWADLNNDLDFDDVGEQIYNAAGLNIGVASGSITVPNGTSAGNKRMRLRRVAVGVGLGGATPCGIAPFGQVHDYTLNVCAPAAAAVAINDQCGSNQFFVNVTTSSFGTGVGATINYSIDGVPQTGVAAALGMVPLGPFTPGARISVSLDNGTACVLSLGDWFSNCPVTLNCSVTNTVSHCYTNGDTRTFTFTTPTAGETVTVTFLSGTMDPNDLIRAYDGTDNTGEPLDGFLGGNPAANEGNLFGTFADLTGATATSYGQSLFIEIESDASNSCFTTPQTTWVFEAECTPGCVNPAGTAGPAVSSCVGAGSFTVPVTVSDLGDASTGTVDITFSLNGVPQTPITVALVDLPYATVLGPYAYGTTVAVGLDHPDGSLCDVNLGSFSPANVCPPANDECAQAIVIPVLPPGGCLPGGTVYTTANATYTTSPVPTCGITGVSPVIRDVWFKFNTGLTVGPLYVYYDQLTATNQSVELYTGSCGALVLGGCFAGGDVAIPIPTQNQDWYIRVISNSTTGVPGTFKFCITTSNTCQGTAPAAAGYAIANLTGNSVQFTFTPQSTGNYIVEYGPSATYVNPGTGGTPAPGAQIATTTVTTVASGSGLATLNCMNPATNYRVFVRKDCGGGDYSVNGRYRGVTFTTLAAPPASSSIVHGTCAQAAAIPDGGCATNNTLNRTFAVTAPGTQLGVDVSLESVDLIVNHLSRSQLRVRLISPTGCERNLVLVRGGTGDNFGNSATCIGTAAASPMKLKDGAPALSTMSTTTVGVTGPFSPEQPLSGFTGDPNGIWTIRICDGTAATLGTLEYVKLNFVTCVGATATTSAVPDCGLNQFSVQVNVTSMGSATGYTITNNINGGTVAVPSTGTYLAGPFPTGSNVTLTLVHNVDVSCNTVLPAVLFNCPYVPCASIGSVAACGGATGATVAAALPGLWSGYGGPYATPGQEKLFTFTATVSGIHQINVTQLTGSWIDFFWKQVGTCTNTGWNYWDDIVATGIVPGDPGLGGIAPNFVAGNTYYIMWDPEDALGRTVNFSIVCPVPPPANDDCATATVIVPAATCVPTAGTTVGGTQSIPAIVCEGFTGTADDDVWYSFVATRTQHRITVNATFDGVVDLRSGACTGTNIACADGNFGVGDEIINAGGLTIGATYFVRVYSYASGTTGTFTICVEAPDCLGTYGGPNIPGASCDDGNPTTALDAYDNNCVCSGIACTTDLDLDFTMDGNDVVIWSLHQQGSGTVAQTGTLQALANSQHFDTCLPNGCYYLRVTDSGGDGIGGGYKLTLNSGTRIIDNSGNFLSGGTSQIAANEGFCLPFGTDRLITTSCDKLDWRSGEFIVANDNPAVTAIWNGFPAGSTQRATTGYEMWWYNPNGGYSFRKYQSHNNSNGLTANAVRACHFNINNWVGNQLQPNVLYNVRVRSRVLGANSEWGAACRFILDPVRAQCPLTKLFDDAGSQYLSCGGTRGIGSGGAFLVHARPVTRYLNGVSTAANRYQFRFVTDNGGTVIVKTSATGQYFVNTLGLTACKDYDVDVRASFNNGTSWCDAYPASNPYAPKWGEVCVFHTSGCPSGNGGNQNIAMEGSTNGLRMFPNPNRGDQVMLSLDVVPEGVNTVSVDIYDVFGKRVSARTVATQDGFVNTVIELNGSLASGMYTVNITAGETTYTERLVIQP